MTKYTSLIEEVKRNRDLNSVVGRLVLHTQSCPTCGAPVHHRCLSLGTSEPTNNIHSARAKLLADALKQEILDGPDG